MRTILTMDSFTLHIVQVYKGVIPDYADHVAQLCLGTAVALEVRAQVQAYFDPRMCVESDLSSIFLLRRIDKLCNFFVIFMHTQSKCLNIPICRTLYEPSERPLGHGMLKWLG